jgi:hypothetical protein
METQTSIPTANAARQTPLQALAGAASRLDAAAWLAMLCIGMGWFFIDTLIVTVGPLHHSVRFYEFAAIVESPARLFVMDGSHPLQALIFGLVCWVVLLSPLVPYIWEIRLAWLANVAPLGLIAICGTLLYVKTSGDAFAVPENSDAFSSNLIHLANDLINRGGAIAARHVSVAAGGYLATIGSAFLAIRGVIRYRAPA